MPELPEVEAARRLLEPAMMGARITGVQVRRANLRRPFPPDFAARLVGNTVSSVGRRAKYLMLGLSSGETLIMHLGMTGHFRVDAVPAAGDAARPDPHDHVVFEMSSGAVVTFNDPRRFGAMDVIAGGQVLEHPTLASLAPEPLSRGFSAATLARACRGRAVSLKVALLDQRVVAGLGNIYAVEALHRAGLSPFRRASTIATPTGLPRPHAVRLAAAIKQVLARAVARQSRAPYRGSRFRVYERDGSPCPTTGCEGVIARAPQAGRSTYWCRTCQR